MYFFRHFLINNLIDWSIECLCGMGLPCNKRSAIALIIWPLFVFHFIVFWNYGKKTFFTRSSIFYYIYEKWKNNNTNFIQIFFSDSFFPDKWNNILICTQHIFELSLKLMIKHICNFMRYSQMQQCEPNTWLYHVLQGSAKNVYIITLEETNMLCFCL